MFDVATNSDGNAAATAAYCRQLKRGGREAGEGRQRGAAKKGARIVIAIQLLILMLMPIAIVSETLPPFPPAVYRGSIKTQQFADFLFSSLALLSTLTSTSQPSSPSPSSPPLFIHNVNTDEKLLNHCNTKPTQSHCTYSSTVPTPAPTPTPTATQTPVPVPAPNAADSAASRAAMIYAAQILEKQSVYAKY